MEKKQFIRNFVAKEKVSSSFLVKHIAVMEARDGRTYLNVVLSDNTGDIECRKWKDAEVAAESIKIGDYVSVKGHINQFQNRLQLIIKEIEKLEASEINEQDYILQASTPPEKMFEELMGIVNELDDVYIKTLLQNILLEPEISRRLKVWQAGKSIHHAYKSGLLEHILSCTTLAYRLSPHYGVNRNYVVAGAILHDLCKIYELTEGPVVEYTEEGKLVGHLVKAVEILDVYAAKTPNFPLNTKTHLKHILLSHHGAYEYGSPKIPQTSEAYLVHLIDLMDSKMNAFEAVKRSDNNAGRWSGFVRHMDRIVYKDELPHNSSFNNERANSSKPAPQNRPKKKYVDETPLKNNMAKFLEDFKTDD